jgi:hypothetical protein
MSYLKLLGFTGATLLAVGVGMTNTIADGIAVFGLECVAMALMWSIPEL